MRTPLLLVDLVLVLMVAGAPAVTGAENEPTAAASKATVAMLTIKGALPETTSSLGLFGELERNLRDTIARLDRAAADKTVTAVVLRIRDATLGRGKLAELRSAIARTRAAGKKVYAQVQSAEAADYLLACACDEIFMPESGTLMIPGVRAEITFYKGLLDKLGIEADMMQVGKFKGAAEPLTRTEMSPEFRRQYENLLDDVYQQMVESISADRRLDRQKVKDLIDVGLFTAADAKAAGLIDAISYGDQLEANLRVRLAVDEIAMIDDYGKTKVDNNFSGMMGFLKLMEMMSGSKPTGRSSSSKKIAVVYAVGTIMPGASSTSIFGIQTVGSDTIVEALQEANDDPSVVAIVLRVDSPGGSALASDLIWRQISEIEKPMIASMGDVAASGGYYISMVCDQIFAEPGTLTGSIGVVGGKLALSGLYDKIGLTTEVISRGKNNGLFSLDQPFTDSQRQAWQNMMQETYRLFTTKAAQGRNMDVADLQPLAGGRVWTGRQAKANGLVDELGTLHDALEAAKTAAGLAADDKIDLLILPKPTSFFDQILGGSQTRLAIQAQVDATIPGASKHLGEIQMLRALFAEPSVLVMPYRLDIK